MSGEELAKAIKEAAPRAQAMMNSIMPILSGENQIAIFMALAMCVSEVEEQLFLLGTSDAFFDFALQKAREYTEIQRKQN